MGPRRSTGPTTGAVVEIDASAALAATSASATESARAGATVGTIACGAASCTVGKEICCDGPEPICQTKAQAARALRAAGMKEELPFGTLCVRGDWKPSHGGEPWGSPLACDDVGDCPEGKVCCLNESGESARCGTMPCDQVCSGKGGCSAGHVCAIGQRTPYACLWTQRSVACGDEICRWPEPTCCHTEDGGPRCTSPAKPCNGGAHACRAAKDCGPGMQCCASSYTGYITYCSTTCLGDGHVRTCETVVECPSIHIASGGDRNATGCEGELVKLCVYEPEP